MPRLATVNPSTDSGPGADMLNGPLKEKQINIFKGLATHAGALEAYLTWQQKIKGGALTPGEHEVVALVISQRNNCEYCLAAHTMIAKGAGVDEATTVAARQGEVDDSKLQALVDFTNAVLDTNGFVTDAHLDAFRTAGYDDKAVIEVLGQLAGTFFTNMYNHVHETEVDFPVAASV